LIKVSHSLMNESITFCLEIDKTLNVIENTLCGKGKGQGDTPKSELSCVFQQAEGLTYALRDISDRLSFLAEEL
jgi:hypothetical protein